MPFELWGRAAVHVCLMMLQWADYTWALWDSVVVSNPQDTQTKFSLFLQFQLFMTSLDSYLKDINDIQESWLQPASSWVAFN